MSNWIEWYAEKNDGRFEGPLPPETPIAVMMLDGEVWDDEPAGAYNWGCVDQAGEIIAYKLIAESTVSEEIFALAPLGRFM